MNVKNDNDTIEQEILKRKLTAPRITQEQIQAQVKDVEYIQHLTKNNFILLMCVITLANGFTVNSEPIVLIEDSSNWDGDLFLDEVLEYKTRNGSVLRWVYEEVANGVFHIGKPSASVSPENDNRKLGIMIATKGKNYNKRLGITQGAIAMDFPDALEFVSGLAENKIWELEGYQLATKLSQSS